MFGRRTAKTRSELVRAEFGQSLDHVRQAAAHAAGGFGATVGPHVGMAKNKATSARGFIAPTTSRVTNAASSGWDTTISAFSPLAESARQGAIRAAKLQAKNANSSSNGNGKPKSKVNKPSVSKVKITATAEENHGHSTLYALLATGVAVGAAGALVARRRTRAKWSEYEPSSLTSDATSFRDAGATSSKTSMAHDVTAGGEPSGSMHKAVDWTKAAVDSLRHKIHEATGDHEDGTMPRTTGKVNEGVSHLADKSDARYNDAASKAGNTMPKAGEGPSRTSNRVEDEVDELIRSAKNGRM